MSLDLLLSVMLRGFLIGWTVILGLHLLADVMGGLRVALGGLKRGGK